MTRGVPALAAPHAAGRASPPRPFVLTFDPRATGGKPLAHDGQEFVYVLEGEIELFRDGERRTLRPGDSAYLDATRPHLFRGLGQAPSRMLAVVWSAG